jgi:hypothetical protein
VLMRAAVLLPSLCDRLSGNSFFVQVTASISVGDSSNAGKEGDFSRRPWGHGG